MDVEAETVSLGPVGVKKAESSGLTRKGAEIDPLVILGSQIYTAVWRSLFDEIAEIDAESLQDELIDILKFGVLDER